MAVFTNDPEQIKRLFKFVSLVNLPAAEQRQVKDFESGEPTLIDGKHVFKPAVVALGKDKEGNDREEKTVSLKVLTPFDQKQFATYVPDGKISITTYIPTGGNRIHYSVTAERLVPVGGGNDQK